MDDTLLENGIAIVGMAGRFPGARNVEQFWSNLRSGIESIRPLCDEDLLEAGVAEATLNDPDYVKAGGVLDDVPMFDAGYFGVSPMDAAIMDPQHRHFLETVVTAFEHAGHAPSKFDGAIGVFAGCGMNAYFVNNILTNPDLIKTVGFFLLRHTGNDRDFLPTTVSYKLDLRGPSMAIQTACSTSLVAVHTACQSLLSGECEMAVAGGSTILVPHGQGYFYKENEPVSPDGHCRAFDADSAGTVVSSGVGAVVLRRLEDALEDGDTVHAVIRGSAVNNDGANKVGYLAPSVEGHARAVAEALSVADIDANTVNYVEAHGTGTHVGDPIEIAALTQAFRESTDAAGFCRIGSVKSNIGHLDTAAGVASLIKVTKALEAKEIPPTLHYSAPNPEIDFESSPFKVNAELADWSESETPRRAGISSLGIGGTNAHLILEEAPTLRPSDPATRTRQVLPLSAKTAKALDAASENLVAWLRENPSAEFTDAAFTLQQGREEWENRRIIVAESSDEAIEALTNSDPLRVFTYKAPRPAQGIAFMFSGAGGQYPNMGREIYDYEPVFRESMDRCFEMLDGLIDFDLRAVVYPSKENEAWATEELERPSRLCPAIVALEWSLVQLWESWGVQPTAMTGHSLGEYTAACIAGVMSLEDTLKLVVLRGNLIDRLTGGGMLSLPMSEAEAQEHLGDELDLAAVNSPRLCVASGELARVEQLRDHLAEQEIEARLVPVDAAGHSRHLDPILEEFRQGVVAIDLSPPEIPYVSNVTGTWVIDTDAQNPDYWVRHLRGTVRFSDGLQTLLDGSDQVLLEVGPAQTLCTFARQQPQKPLGVVPSVRRSGDEIGDQDFLLASLGRLWTAGAAVDWSVLRPKEFRHRIALPTYPFEHKPYWIDPVKPVANETSALEPIRRIDDVNNWFLRSEWQEKAAGVREDSEPKTWLAFVDEAGIGRALADRLRDGGHTVVTVAVGDTFYNFGANHFSLAPEQGRPGYQALIEALAEVELLPDRVVHCWSVTIDKSHRPGSSFLDRTQESGFYSLLHLMQSIGEVADQSPEQVVVLSNGMQSLPGRPALYPEKATVIGPVRVIPREYPGIVSRSIDVEVPLEVRKGLFTGTSVSVRETDLATFVTTIESELLSAVPAQCVVLTGNSRYEERLSPTPLEPNPENPAIRHGGVYLVTGGMGGIGFAVGEQLATRHAAKVVLLGRSPFPAEPEWDGWLASHGDTDRTSCRIQAIRKAKEAGGELVPVTADVVDIGRMHQVLVEIEQRFGAINGVIHAAGSVSDGVMQTKTSDGIEEVFSTKLHGTLLLDELFSDRSLDFMVLFSSMSSYLGPAGQVDYVGANAFINAFAEKRNSEGNPTLAAGWGIWNDVGEGSAMARQMLGEEPAPTTSRLTGHPLLGECVEESDNRWRWEAHWNTADLWVLDHHRDGSGTAILPGTGYIEMLRVATTDATSATRFEIRDLSFLEPLVVAGDEPRRVITELNVDGDQYTFSIYSGNDRVEHANAVVALDVAGPPPVICLTEVHNRCSRSRQRAEAGDALKSSQESRLQFGPSWSVLRAVSFGEQEACAELELDGDRLDDLEQQLLHPGLLDIATGYALPLIGGWKPENAIYVPLSYGAIRVHGPLVQKLVSVVRSHPDNHSDSDVVRFDVSILDTEGHCLVEVENYQMRRLVGNSATLTMRQSETRQSERRTEPTPAEQVFLDTLENGIRLIEGVEALEIALQQGRGGALFISSIDAQNWIAHIEAASAQDNQSGGITFARPELENEYEAPRDEVEQELVTVWQEFLGVDQIGIRDDFFDLGGHSLIAVRLFAKVKKRWGIDWPISVLFEAPCIAQFAEQVKTELGIDGSATSTGESSTKTFRFLVPLNRVSTGAAKPPLFIVAGMFGNVLNLRHVAKHLGEDQPVFGLQARGLYGDDEPHESFVDAARDYLDEVKQVQPEGPYRLSGFSGGGVTAFEMAHQLKGAGEDVAALIMLDAIPPHPAWPLPSRTDEMKIKLQHLYRNIIRHPLSWLENKLRWKREQEERDVPSEQKQTPAEFRSRVIELAFRSSLDRYEMHLLDGEIVLLRPPLDTCYALGSGRFANRDRQLVEHKNWWAPWVTGAVDVTIVPGNHDSMVLEPNVRILAKHIKEVLDKSTESPVKDEAGRTEELDAVVAAG